MITMKRFALCMAPVLMLVAPAVVEAKCYTVCCSAQGVCTQAEYGPCCEYACCDECSGDDCLPGVCTAPTACCFPNGVCEDLDPICCEADGGRTIAGSLCGPPLRCPTRLHPAPVMSEYDFGPVDEPDAAVACYPESDEDQGTTKSLRQ